MKPAVKGALAGGAALLAGLIAWNFWDRKPDPVTPTGDEAVVEQPSGKVLTADENSDQTASGASVDNDAKSDEAQTDPVADTDQDADATQTAAVSDPADTAVPAQNTDGGPADDPDGDDAAGSDAGQDAGPASDPADAASDDETDPLAPRFDVVRVDPNGQTVLAGNAEPGTTVEIVLDGEVIAEAKADSQGNFVSILDLVLSGDAQSLQLRVPRDEEEPNVAETTVGPTETEPQATETVALSDQEPAVQGSEGALTGPNLVNGKVPPVGDGMSGETTAGDATEGLAAVNVPEDPNPTPSQPVGVVELPSVEIAPIEPGQVSPDGVSVNANSRVVEPTNQPQETAGTGGTAVSPVPDAPAEVEAGRYRLSAPVIILPSAEDGASPTLLQPTANELALVQPSGGDVRGVVLDQITYSDVGDVKLRGRGRVGRAIRIYGNGLLIGTTKVTQDGTWAMALASERGKQIKLFRFDEIDNTGGVSSRIETPFEYSSLSPKVVRERKVVIQRGDVLWRIAEQFYGEGVRYSLIYGANTELIRDPDLIYPGQEFSIPELVDAN
ncbi:MAG: LysM peptidoglycan-binding domain-containing protein [Pseudomonadota bacterium]